MKQVFAPHLNRHVKFGRKPATQRPRFHLKNYLTEALPVPPTSADYSPKAKMPLADIYGNDTYGDCVIAGGYHIEGVATGNAGTAFHATSSQIIKDYSAIGGYVPGDPSTDNGCELLDAIAYWTKHGFANGTKLLGYAAVDATNQSEVELACYLFENLMFGVALPDKWISPFPSGSGFTWDTAGAPDPNNGHCFISCGYGAPGVEIDSWGLIGTVSYAAVKKYAAAKAGGELYVLLTPDQLAKGQAKAPNGIAWNDLLSDFNQIGGNVPAPAPTPQPVPVPPSPVPAVALTLDQVEALLKKNWAAA